MCLGQGLYLVLFWLVLLRGYRDDKEKGPFWLNHSKSSVWVMPLDGKNLDCKYCSTGIAVQWAFCFFIHWKCVVAYKVKFSSSGKCCELFCCISPGLFGGGYLFLYSLDSGGELLGTRTYFVTVGIPFLLTLWLQKTLFFQIHWHSALLAVWEKPYANSRYTNSAIKVKNQELF